MINNFAEGLCTDEHSAANLKPNTISSCRRCASSSNERMASVAMRS